MSKIKRRYDLIAFDWDGTLFDSTKFIVHCIQSAMQDLSEPVPTDEQASFVIGMALIPALQYIAPHMSSDKYVHLGERYRYHYSRRQDELNLFQGVVEMLHELKQRQHILTIATGKSRQGLNQALQQSVELQHLFDGSKTADETAGKPDPQMLFELMSEYGVSPERTLMIGDTTHDLQMAENAGCDSVAVAYGAHTIEQLSGCRSCQLVHSVDELHGWLNLHA